MGHDDNRDRSGDQAAWCDLVARLELPPAVDPANPPWPDRENLRPAARRRDTAKASEEPAAGKDTDPGSEQDAARNSSPRTDSGHTARTRSGGGRVVRPARATRFPVPAEEQAPGAARRRPGPGDVPGLRGFPAAGVAPGWSVFGPVAVPGIGPAGETVPAEPAPPVSQDPELMDWQELDENADERYIPPHVPPQPKLDPVARGAWTAVFGGPGYLFVATTLEWQVPGWAELAAIIAFIAGFLVLVSRLGDGPSRRDGPDQGAVV